MIHVEKHVMRDGSLHVLMSGVIDDQFDGTQLFDSKEAKKIVLHLGGIRSISSVGVRNLDNFVGSFAPREVSLIHISAAVAAQVIMIPGLCGAAKIESVKLPFTCRSCGGELLHSVPWRAFSREQSPKCKCGMVMDLDVVPEQYLPSA